MEANPEARHAVWREARLAELLGPESWLGLVGLYELGLGASTVGSGAGCAIRLPAGPEFLGAVTRDGDALAWRPRGGDARVLASDRDGPPTIVEAGSLVLFVIEREGRLALRVRDRDWAAKRAFTPPECYPYDETWRIAARWERLPQPLLVEIADATGELRRESIDRRAAFVHAGEAVHLLPMPGAGGGVLFAFRDLSSGRETYGAGRFLQAEAGGEEEALVLDFNRALNPPCAFTPFATCPLPPAENWLPFTVPAGEKKPQAASGASS